MKTTTPSLLCLLACLFLISCGGGKQAESTGEDNSEEAAAAELEAMAPEPAEEATVDETALAPLDCAGEGGTPNLANLYQFSPKDADDIEQEDGWTYWNILQNRMLLLDQLAACEGAQPEDDLELVERWVNVPLLNTTAEGKRTDLMPVIDEEFLNINPAFVKKAAELLIPEPGTTQYNGLVFQQIYNVRMKGENRDLYYAHWLLQHYGLLENELQHYAPAATTRTVRDDGTVMVNNNSYGEYQYFVETRYWELGEVNKEVHKAGNFMAEYLTFWLRRYLDGSANELLAAQRKILKAYDQEWLRGLDQAADTLPTLDLWNMEEGGIGLYMDAMDAGEGQPDPEHLTVQDQVTSEGDALTIMRDVGRTVDFIGKNWDTEEQEGYNVVGLLAPMNLMVLEHYGPEMYEYLFIDMVTGEAVLTVDHAETVMTDEAGNYLMVSRVGPEFSSMAIYQMTEEGALEQVFSSPLLRPINGLWIADGKLLLNFEQCYGTLTLP